MKRIKNICRLVIMVIFVALVLGNLHEEIRYGKRGSHARSSWFINLPGLTRNGWPTRHASYRVWSWKELSPAKTSTEMDDKELPPYKEPTPIPETVGSPTPTPSS